jgi:probable rRNA maturation factor
MIYLDLDQQLIEQYGISCDLQNGILDAAQTALIYEKHASVANMTIVLTEDTQLQKLNFEFLQINAPTDVLSFPVDERDPETKERYLGDIIISYPRAQMQAATGGHSLRDELFLLVVHGVLHLLGYDHSQEADKRIMWEHQSMILKDLGCIISLP